jgi:tRNA (Thr-GGU) A37 N-methylase
VAASRDRARDLRNPAATRLRIGPIEAIEGTPVVDVKPVLVDCADA